MYGIFEECGALWQMNLHLTLIKIKKKTKQQQQMYSIKRHVIMLVNTKYTRIINQTSIPISKFFILPSKNILSLCEPVAQASCCKF